MFHLKKPDSLELENERLKELLMDLDPLDADYEKLQKRLAINNRLLADSKPNRLDVDGNTVLTVAANLVGILLILQHENLHAVSSKALGFIMKLKP